MESNEVLQPFLASEDKNGDVMTRDSTTGRHHRWRLYGAAMIHLILILLYTTVTVVITMRMSMRSSDVPRQALEDLTISYKPFLFKNLGNNSFADPPSPATDTAWENLLSSMNIRVTNSELGDQSSVPLPDGGNLAWLSVSHNIHCLNVLRKWNHRVHYFPDLAPDFAAETHPAKHANHCIERLRQALLCQADTTSLTVFKWDPSTPKPMFDITERLHQCINWDQLMGSVAGRVVDGAEWSRLRNPLLEAER